MLFIVFACQNDCCGCHHWNTKVSKNGLTLCRHHVHSGCESGFCRQSFGSNPQSFTSYSSLTLAKHVVESRFRCTACLCKERQATWLLLRFTGGAISGEWRPVLIWAAVRCCCPPPQDRHDCIWRTGLWPDSQNQPITPTAGVAQPAGAGQRQARIWAYERIAVRSRSVCVCVCVRCMLIISFWRSVFFNNCVLLRYQSH